VRKILQFSWIFLTFNESANRGCKKAYLQELHKRKKSGSSMVISKLKEMRNGHLLMLGEDLDVQ